MGRCRALASSEFPNRLNPPGPRKPAFGRAACTSHTSEARWEAALSCTEFAGLALYLASCNAAITCCLKGGHWQLALRILHGMQKAQLSPDVVSYTAVMSACRCLAKLGGIDLACHAQMRTQYRIVVLSAVPFAAASL